MNPFWEAVSFYSLAVLILASALGVALLRNIVHCAGALATCFLGVACIYILLQAFFLFGVQLLIYVGAITVLILFAVMLTRDIEGHFIQQTNRLSFYALAAAIAMFIALAYVSYVGHPYTQVRSAPPQNSVVGIGLAFVREYVVPFEVASIVLLVALVGAIVIARDDKLAPVPGVQDALTRGLSEAQEPERTREAAVTTRN